ncbi:methylmalonyl-CoA epimerase [Synergistes jonesii]|uniref:methylmalonyl-CoA epimerase n=1 Tax=Synergistes jonesii TaxID=2754 RepID=UPI00248E58DA|nr:methylmalonyl-CoA epimerase [Synergistes jonesii]
MKIKNVDHIGVAVKSIDEALKFWEATLGVKCHGIEEVKEQKVKTAFLPIDDTEFELLEGTAEDSPVTKYIEKNGQGIQHVAVRVEDLEAALAELKEKGVRLIDEKPRIGAGGAKIAFVHPKASGGVLLELCQRN